MLYDIASTPDLTPLFTLFNPLLVPFLPCLEIVVIPHLVSI
jgi:hypothetical protein